MAGLFGIGGSAAKTDRKYQLTSWDDLQGLFTTGATQGRKQLKTGEAGVQKAQDYWSKLMSGDPAALSQVLAPQIGTIKGQVGQNIAGIQQFQGRSGGSSAAVQAQNVEAQRSIQQLFDLLGPMAAEEFGNLAEFQVGTGENLLGLAGTSAAEMGAQASGARQLDVPVQQAQQGAVFEGLGSLLGLI